MIIILIVIIDMVMFGDMFLRLIIIDIAITITITKSFP